MNTLSYLLLLLMLLSSIKLDEYDEMSHDDIISESQLCGESNFFEESCLTKSNCVFVHWNVAKLNSALHLCMSYSEIMRYYIVNPKEYLQKKGSINHTTITKSNFCDVIDDSNNFLDTAGDIEYCRVSTV